MSYDPAVVMWIYGAGGFGRETLDACGAAGIEVEGFLDDARAGATAVRRPVRRPTDVSPGHFVVAIADPAVRLRLHASLVVDGWEPRTVLDPRATIGIRSTVGEGSIVLATAYVSVDVSLGPATHLNYGVTIGHDAVGGAGVTVLPGANVGGTVSLGEGVLVGSGAVVLQGLSVGAAAVVGAGAVVTRSVDAGATVVGVPARALEPTRSS